MAALSTITLTETPSLVGDGLTTASAPLLFMEASSALRYYFVAADDPAPARDDPHGRLRWSHREREVEELEVIPSSGHYLGDLYMAAESGTATVKLVTGDAPA